MWVDSAQDRDYWEVLVNAALNRDGRDHWLNSLLLDVSPPYVCGIFRNGLSGSQMNSLSVHRWRRNIELKRIQPLTTAI